ncbi:hypothetical protein Egran_01904 [Elaphomyces granulatus]|uniref:Uncharacterized protein n=1 Tax=Elaphomyces granulatus TaxID=519963 RepID=A0A232M1Q1_9EURO|nr:hypothetical protein Egran_01904 [Elaphomyces granulatus]
MVFREQDLGSLGMPESADCLCAVGAYPGFQEHHVVHVRATPASGKSTLSRLLEQHVKRKHPDLPIKWCSWPMNLLKRLGLSGYNNHKSVTHRPAGRSEAKTPTPIYFDPNQRISIRPPQDPELRVSVFFTRAEFDDVVHRVMVYESRHGQAFSPNGDVLDYIWNLTNGHPHATRMISGMLATSDEVLISRSARQKKPFSQGLCGWESY